IAPTGTGNLCNVGENVLGDVRCVLVGDPKQLPAAVNSKATGMLKLVEAFVSASNRQVVQL
ncbi:hypothetical protein KI387_003035, partial [Taxus chinensis]